MRMRPSGPVDVTAARRSVSESVAPPLEELLAAESAEDRGRES